MNQAPTMSTTNAPWTKICAVTDIPILGSRRITRSKGMAVAIFRTDGDEVFALLDRCPHKGGPLSQGIVFGKHVACPLHNWAIALSDGQARAPDEGCAVKFQVKLEAGQVHLNQVELDSLGLNLEAPIAGPIARCKE
jgi:nitrite reductase (NADH) small subunit